MPMLANPSDKYAPLPPSPIQIRSWPSRRTTAAPMWLSTDLRDGNQALINPMSNETKLKLFKMICNIGFKEIEIAYPSASKQEFQFCRQLIENNEIPDDVAIQIITPCREDLIRTSIDALAGSKHAIIHLYNAVSPVFREVVFRNSREKTLDLVVNSVKLVKKLTEECTARTGTHFQLNYCMETFSQTEPEFSVQLGNAVLEAWGKAGPGKHRVMFNLAATVEVAPPNHYADQVEYFATHIFDRDNVILSLHNHNDRGTGVAAAELGLLAGGQRVEGCLLGNGERTGNVDLITLALNLYSLGISPNLDFSNLKEITQLVEKCNETTVHPRYPYAGALVFTAFAGTHQDAIKKGFEAQRRRHAEADKTGGKKLWAMPYIPIDPKDLGYGYENLIRVSSQSGKAGAAYIIKENLQLDIPRGMQTSFYHVVQREADASGKEMTVPLIINSFRKTYFVGDHEKQGRLFLRGCELFSTSSNGDAQSPAAELSESSTWSSDSGNTLAVRMEIDISVDGEDRKIRGEGSSPVKALCQALKEHLNVDISCADLTTQSVTDEDQHASFVDVRTPDSKGAWGVGIAEDRVTSRLRAVISGANALVGEHDFPRRKVLRPIILSQHRSASSKSFYDIPMRTGSVPPPSRWPQVDRPSTPVN